MFGKKKKNLQLDTATLKWCQDYVKDLFRDRGEYFGVPNVGYLISFLNNHTEGWELRKIADKINEATTILNKYEELNKKAKGKLVEWVDFIAELSKFLPDKIPRESTIEGFVKKDVLDCDDDELELAFKRLVDRKLRETYADLQKKFEALVS